jgi:hypothetical protein
MARLELTRVKLLTELHFKVSLLTALANTLAYYDIATITAAKQLLYRPPVSRKTGLSLQLE